MDAELSEQMSAPGDPLLRKANVSSGHLPASDDLTELFRVHRSRLVRLAFAITLDAAVAEEVVQDAFVGLQRNLDRVDNAVGYLQRSVVNLSVSVIRRRRVVNRQPRPRPRPEQFCASAPEIDEMWTRVERLPARQRAVVVLRFWEDMSLAEIARVLNRPTSSVKTTLRRAINTLKEDLS